MRVTVEEPVRAERIECEVLVTHPSGHPADMELGGIVVNHRPFVERPVVESRPTKVTERTTNKDGTVSEVITESTEEVVVRVEMVPPPPWSVTFTMPVDEPRTLEPGTYEVTIEDIEVEVEPAREVEVPNPAHVPVVLGEGGAGDTRPTLTEVIPPVYATRQVAVLKKVKA